MKKTKHARRMRQWHADHPEANALWYVENKEHKREYNRKYWQIWYSENKLRKLTQNEEYQQFCRENRNYDWTKQ